MPVACISGAAGRQIMAGGPPATRCSADRSATVPAGTGWPSRPKPLALTTWYSQEWRVSTPLGVPVVPPVYISQWPSPRWVRGRGGPPTAAG